MNLDNYNGKTIGPGEPVFTPSERIAQVLALLESTNVPAESKDEIVAVIESLEAEIERLARAALSSQPAAPETTLQALARIGYVTATPRLGSHLTDKARAVLGEADKTRKDQLIDEYVDLAVEVAKTHHEPDPVASSVIDPRKAERYALLAASMDKDDFPEIDRRF